MENVELVRRFLRGQNLEQVGRLDDAIALYESAIAAGFDSTGPYDRLIGIYAHRAAHADVIRVVESALRNVQTYEDKRAWYREMGAQAERAAAVVPRAVPKETAADRLGETPEQTAADRLGETPEQSGGG